MVVLGLVCKCRPLQVSNDTVFKLLKGNLTFKFAHNTLNNQNFTKRKTPPTTITVFYAKQNIIKGFHK